MKMLKALILAAIFCMPMVGHAELESEKQVEFTQAIEDGNTKLLDKFFKEEPKLGINDTYFAWSALHVAVNRHSLKSVKYFVEKGININYQHPLTKMTALQLAAFNHDVDMVKYLISKGADVNTKLRGNVSIIRALHDMGDTQMEEIFAAAGAKDDGCQEEKCF